MFLRVGQFWIVSFFIYLFFLLLFFFFVRIIDLQTNNWIKDQAHSFAETLSND